MLEKLKTEHTFPKTTSLFNIIHHSHRQVKEEEIRQLFMVPKREIFELNYLYSSPHFAHSTIFRQLVKLLERANQEAHRFNQTQSVVQGQSDPNVVKLACLKFIYREMLCIAVKSTQEIKDSQIAEKIKEWYYSLADMHSFLQGVNIKKKDHTKDDILEENRIRANYVSNVFDEINDYLRRKVDYLPRKTPVEEETKTNKFKRPETKSSCNLPLIDKAIYKREDERMREYRQKQFQKFYLTTMSNNKNRMKEAGLVKFRSKHNQSKHKNQENLGEYSSVGFMTVPQAIYGRGSENVSPKRQASWKKNLLGKVRDRQNNLRLSLNNINGINLVRNKFE